MLDYAGIVAWTELRDDGAWVVGEGRGESLPATSYATTVYCVQTPSSGSHPVSVSRFHVSSPSFSRFLD